MNFIEINGKRVGYIEGNTYFCERDRSHLFIKYENGLGLSASVIDFAESLGVENVCIDFEHKIKLECPIYRFYIKGTKFEFKYINKKTGKEVLDLQYILPIKFFNKKEVTEMQEVLI